MESAPTRDKFFTVMRRWPNGIVCSVSYITEAVFELQKTNCASLRYRWHASAQHPLVLVRHVLIKHFYVLARFSFFFLD